MPVQANPNLECTPDLHAASREIGQLWMTSPGGGRIVGEYILRGQIVLSIVLSHFLFRS